MKTLSITKISSNAAVVVAEDERGFAHIISGQIASETDIEIQMTAQGYHVHRRDGALVNDMTTVMWKRNVVLRKPAPVEG